MTVIDTTAEKQASKTSVKDLFAIHNYRLIWLGQIISDFSDSMTNLALLLMINRLTGSIAALATMSIVLLLPRLLLGFIAGVFVDRLDRKKLMVYSYLIRGVLVMGFLLVDSADKIWLFYLIGFFQGCVATFFEPARSALLPSLIPSNALMAANSISVTCQNIFYTLGGAAAGVLVGLFDSFNAIYLVNAGAFILSAVLINQIRNSVSQTTHQSNLSPVIFLNQVREGIKISFGNRLLAGTIVAMGLTMLGAGAVNVLLVPLMVNDLGISETWMGATGISQTVALVISGSIIAGMANRINPIRIIPWALIGFGASMALIFAASDVWQVMANLFVVSLFIPGISSSAQTILQITVPDHLLGRVNSARVVLVMTANLISMGLAGILAEKIGTGNVFIISGAFAVLGGLAALLMFRGQKLNPIPLEEGA